jgi:Armadillo/beta-catenin-like repeat
MDNNHCSADTSGRSSSGGGSSTAGDFREMVDFHAFLLGLVGNGAGTGDARHPNREDDDVGDDSTPTPAEQGRSIRAMAARNPEMQQLMDIVGGTLKRRMNLVTYFRQLVSSTRTKDGKKVTTVTRRKDPLIQAVMASGAVRDLVAIMGGHNNDDSVEATWAIIHFVDAGTKLHIQHAIDEGVLPKFVSLLVSPSVELRRDAARILGNMANVSQFARFRWREPLWDSGAIDAMITSLQQDDDDVVLQYAAGAIGHVCRSEPDEERIRSVVPTLAQLLYYHDEKVLKNACSAFTSFLTVDGGATSERVQTIIRMGVGRRLVELLQHSNPEMHR